MKISQKFKGREATFLIEMSRNNFDILSHSHSALCSDVYTLVLVTVRNCVIYWNVTVLVPDFQKKS